LAAPEPDWMGARRVVGLQRPVAAHLLERHPPEEQRSASAAFRCCRSTVSMCDMASSPPAGLNQLSVASVTSQA
jgi:hypothetical protein